MTETQAAPRGSAARRPAAAVRLLAPTRGCSGLAGVLVVLCLVGQFTRPELFLTEGNISTILRLAAAIGVVSVGMTFVIISGGIDLSVGASLALAARLADDAGHPVLRPVGDGPLCELAVGLGCGLVNGVLVAYGKIVPFIVTLAMYVSARGLAERISGRRSAGRRRPGLPRLLPRRACSASRLLIWLFALVFAVGWVVLNRTTFGRRTFAVGGNAEASRLAGINVKRHLALVYGVAGLCCGIAALMVVARTTAGASTNGMLYELDAIAAVVIGGTLLTGGRGSLIGTLIGVLIFTVLSNLFTLNNLDTDIQNIAKGVIIVLAVLLQFRARKARTGPVVTTDGGSPWPNNPSSAAGDSCSAGPPSAPARCWPAARRTRPRTRTAGAPVANAGNNAEPGKPVTIGFSAPAADHGWIAAITKNAKAQAQKFSEVKFNATEGTNDVNQQISQVETLINAKVDVLVILPFDGKALTAVGQQAMDAGHPGDQPRPRLRHAAGVPNLDRRRQLPDGRQRRQLHRRSSSRRRTSPTRSSARSPGIDSLPLTQDRSKGFKDALAPRRVQGRPARCRRSSRAESGEQQTANLLQARAEAGRAVEPRRRPGHRRRRGDQAPPGRKEFFMVGGAGSKNMMNLIKADASPIKATVLYSPSMASSAIALARLLGQNKGMGDLAEHEIPADITTYSAVVTKENVDQYLDVGFDS